MVFEAVDISVKNECSLRSPEMAWAASVMMPAMEAAAATASISSLRRVSARLSHFSCKGGFD